MKDQDVVVFSSKRDALTVSPVKLDHQLGKWFFEFKDLLHGCSFKYKSRDFRTVASIRNELLNV